MTSPPAQGHHREDATCARGLRSVHGGLVPGRLESVDQTSPAAPDEGSDPATAKQSGREHQDPLRGSRTSGLWVAIVASGVVLVLLIVFIAQNTDGVLIRFLGWQGEAPLAVALLAATVAGLFLAAIAGSLRILQLRRRVRRELR